MTDDLKETVVHFEPRMPDENPPAPPPLADEYKPFHATQYCCIDPATVPPRQWLYGRHLIRGFLSVTIAPGGYGKSSLLIAEALALATGKALLGKEVSTPLNVWLWNLEDPRDDLVRRIEAARQHYNLTEADIGGRLFIDSGREQELITATYGRNGAIIQRPVVENLVSEIRSRKIDVFIGDPFISSHRVPENDNAAIDAVAKNWSAIADKAGAAIELLHHTRKSEGVEITTESARGGKALTDAARNVRVLNRMTDNEAAQAGVDNHRLHFRVYSDKSNLAPPSDKSDWFRLENVALANGDHVGVATPWQWPDPFADITVVDLRRVQDAIHGKQYRENSQAKAWAGYAVADVLDLDTDHKHERAKIKSCIKTWLENGALKVVSVKDNHGVDRPVVEVGEWVK